MVDASKSKMLKRYSSGHPMMDSGRHIVSPKNGPDDDNKTKIAGSNGVTPNMPDRDGPAKKSAAAEPAAKKANGTSKQTPNKAQPKGKVTPPIKKAPTVAGQPVQGTQPVMASPPMAPMQMPPANQVKAMKSSLKGSAGRFTR